MEKEVKDYELSAENRDQIVRLNQITRTALRSSNHSNHDKGIQMTEVGKQDKQVQLVQPHRYDKGVQENALMHDNQV
jgi:hypothetical protein